MNHLQFQNIGMLQGLGEIIGELPTFLLLVSCAIKLAYLG